ncbi:uncharacterized protein [Procambarus clarkii]|uniref:uncharacterized protein n=1 Tax=Procambarus clarkii TaxID=6728 RepID=UPI003743CACE
MVKSSDCMTNGIHLEISKFICLYDGESVCGTKEQTNGKRFPRVSIYSDVSSDIDNRNSDEMKPKKMPLGERGKHSDNRMKTSGCERTNEAASVDLHSKEGLQLSWHVLPITSFGSNTEGCFDYSCNLETKDVNVYDVLPWKECFENMTAGTIIPPSLNNKNALTFQRTFDAGIFLREAEGMPLYVFKEDCPSSEGKMPLAVFIQLPNKDFIKIKCKKKSSNVYIGTSPTESMTSDSQQQNLGQINFSLGSPECCSTPKHDLPEKSILTVPYSNPACYRSHDSSDVDVCELSRTERPSEFGRCSSYVRNKKRSLMRDKRVADIQMERKKYQASVVNTFPEVVDHMFQPVVILEKIKENDVQGLTLYNGFDDDFDDDKSKYQDDGKKCCWRKSSKDTRQSARTAHIMKVQKCSLGSGNAQTHAEFSPENTCNKQTNVNQNGVSVICCSNSHEIRRVPVFDFEKIKTKLEMFFGEESEWLSKIMLSGSDPQNGRQVSQKSRIPSTKSLDYITFHIADRLKSVSSNSPVNSISDTTKPSSKKSVSQSFGGMHNHHLIGEDTPAPTRKHTLLRDRSNASPRKTKLCSFQPVKKNRSRKKKGTSGSDKVQHTSLDVIKKDGFTIRLWQNYNKDVFNAIRHECTVCKKVFRNEKTLINHIKRKHSKSERQRGGPPVKEFYICQPCGASLNSKFSLEKHVSSMKHLTLSKTCEKNFIAAWKILGFTVIPNENEKGKLELVEILDEEIEDEVNTGEEGAKDQAGVSLYETLNKTTSHVKTYIYNTSLLSQFKEILGAETEPEVNSGIKIQEFLQICKGKSLPWFSHQPTTSETKEHLESFFSERSSQEELLPPKTTLPINKDRYSSNDLQECTSSKEIPSLNKGTAVKWEKYDKNAASNDNEWVEEVVTDPNSKSCQLMNLTGSYLKKKQKKCPGKVVVCKRLYRTYQNKTNQTVGNCDANENSLKSNDFKMIFSPKYNYQVPHSPYYPHPLIDDPKELYDSSLTQQDFPSQTKLNDNDLNLDVPHMLYEKHKYQRYKDLDKPIEFYHFDFDMNGNFITTTENIGKCNEGANNSPSVGDSVLGEKSRDSYTDLLNSTSTMSADHTLYMKHDTVFPLFTCELRSGAGTSNTPLQPTSSLNTPVQSPVHKGQSSITSALNNLSSLIVSSASKEYDQDFEDLWNMDSMEERVLEDQRQDDVLNNNFTNV